MTEDAETKLIVTTSYSGTGHLKAARLGTRYVSIVPTLVSNPLPDPAAYFDARPAPSESEQAEWSVLDNVHWFGVNLGFDASQRTEWPGLRDVMAQYHHIELWIDPDPNSQLTLMLLLDHLRDDDGVLGKARLHQSPTLLGEGIPDRQRLARLPLRPIDSDDVALASKVWRAYAAPTPEGMSALLRADLNRFPCLRDALLLLLDELPGARDGLGATQRAFLRMLAEHDRMPEDLFTYRNAAERPWTFGFWQLGATLDTLCAGTRPAIAGLEEGPFTLAMHDDPERYQHYYDSRLTLTEFGQSLLDGKGDFARENRIERWWGGTALRNESLWRWDGERGDVLQIL